MIQCDNFHLIELMYLNLLYLSDDIILQLSKMRIVSENIQLALIVAELKYILSSEVRQNKLREFN